MGGEALLHTPQHGGLEEGREELIDSYIYTNIQKERYRDPPPPTPVTPLSKPSKQTKRKQEAKQNRKKSNQRGFSPPKKGRTPASQHSRAPKDSSLQEKRLRDRGTPPKRQTTARATSSSFNGRGETQRTGAKKIHTTRVLHAEPGS